MIFFSFVLCAFLAPFGQAKIHEHMSVEEVMEVFQTTHAAVPEYEVAGVKHMRHKRSGDVILQTRSFGQDIQLYLEPTDGVLAGKNTKVYTAKSDYSAPKGIQYRLITNAMEGLGEYYHDVKNNAAVTVKPDENGEPLVDGILGNNLAIRPMPERIRDKHQFLKLHFDFSGINNYDVDDFDTIYHNSHFVFKTPNNYQSQNVIGSFPISQFYAQAPSNLNSKVTYSRSKRDLPEVVYPEILVIVDENLYSNFSQNARKTVSYIVSFWNGVDLRYRGLEKPKVRLNIAGIILAENILPYVRSSFVESTGQLDAGNLLENMGKYLYEENRIKFKTDYDVAMHMTGYDLSSYDEPSKVWAASTTGLAYIAGACRTNDHGKSIAAVGTFEDKGGFGGILSGAHELAHLFGVPHDGQESPEYVGGPGAKSCDWDEGHIMSYYGTDAKKVRFSTCSQQSMRYYFETKTAECLRNVPHVDEPLKRILPGKYMSLDEQCMMETGTKACHDFDERSCTQLFCNVEGTNKCTSSTAAAEGSPCGNGKYCLNGECVPETVKTVPGLLPPSAPLPNAGI